ncbi:NF-X1-type zinc finger protein NFXL1 [Tanacetum coccineum]
MKVVAICAIQNLVMYSCSNKRAVAEAGGVQVILDLIGSSDTDASVQAAMFIKLLFSNNTIQEMPSARPWYNWFKIGTGIWKCNEVFISHIDGAINLWMLSRLLFDKFWIADNSLDLRYIIRSNLTLFFVAFHIDGAINLWMLSRLLFDKFWIADNSLDLRYIIHMWVLSYHYDISLQSYNVNLRDEEDYMNYRKYKYLRLDGSSTIMNRRDMVKDFQHRNDIFAIDKDLAANASYDDDDEGDHCRHRCVVQCHPSPCPPCKAFAPPKMCPCGKKTITIRCSDQSQKSLLTCRQRCGKPLNCQPIMDEVVVCGDVAVKGHVNVVKDGLFSCKSKCGKTLGCGNHVCKETSHHGVCEDCELLPVKFSCGQTCGAPRDCRHTCTSLLSPSKYMSRCTMPSGWSWLSFEMLQPVGLIANWLFKCVLMKEEDFVRLAYTSASREGTRSYEELVDKGLENNYDREEMYRMVLCAAACLRYYARQRAKMSQMSLRRKNDCEYWKRISDKRMKNEAKNDKTEHGMEEREKSQSQKSKSKVNQKVKPEEKKSKPKP